VSGSWLPIVLGPGDAVDIMPDRADRVADGPEPGTIVAWWSDPVTGQACAVVELLIPARVSNGTYASRVIVDAAHLAPIDTDGPTGPSDGNTGHGRG
jgi:hypothetical protein